MTRDSLLAVAATRPGKVTAEMIRDIADTMHGACEAIHDVCERFLLSPAERKEMELRDAEMLEKATKAQQKAAAKALEDAKKQEKKNADAHAELAAIEAARRRPAGG